MKRTALQCKRVVLREILQSFVEHIPKLEVPIVVDNRMTW
jgi:hypothetical protein